MKLFEISVINIDKKVVLDEIQADYLETTSIGANLRRYSNFVNDSDPIVYVAPAVCIVKEI